MPLSPRLLEYLLTFFFVITSAFIVADMVNILGKGALQTVSSFAMPKPANKPVGPSSSAGADEPTAPPPAPAPPPVKLLGTTTGAYPFAVILAPAAKEQKLYGLRDDVGGGWLIDEITVNKVVLKKGEEKEVVEVMFFETEPPKPLAVAVGGAGAASVAIRLDPRDVEAALSDLNKIMMQARVIPYMDGGKISGYTIFNIVPGSLYTKLGIQNSDVVERVNGVEIKNPDALYQLFQQIRNQKRIVLDLRRSGTRRSVNIEIF
jgi:general secretion pathway protein C